jgi:DNA-binding beta-propeller fold protein YncE
MANMELFSNNLIRIIGNSGSEGKGENQFAQPRGICMDAKTKEVFIVDCNNHRVQVYHLNSLAYIRQIGKGDKGATKGNLNYPVGICMDDHHDIFVADTNNNRIAVFNRVTGVHVRSIGSKGTLVGLLNSPYGVCLDLCSNLLYVADYDNHRVQAFDKETGDFVKTVGNGYGDGPGQLNQPIVICIDYDSNQILVADYSNNRITVFHRLTGSYIKSIGETDGPNKLHGPRGVCLSKESNLIFVSDRENHRVQMYNRETHAFIRNIGGDGGIGSNPGQFNRPMELCVNAEEGVLLVVDGYNHRVQVIELMELQLEKLRLKAIAQSKADAILRGKNIPRPSLLAVCTAVDIHSIVQFDALSCAVQVKHPFLDPVFDASLTIDETVLLLTHLQSLLTTAVSTSNDAPRLLRTDETAGSNNTSLHQQLTMSENTQMVRQSDIFMSILEELHCSAFVDVEGQSSNGATAGIGFFDPTFYRLSSPALFALKSLLSRGWKPTVFSEGIIKLLIAFVSNVDSCIVDSNERVQVLSALTSILFAVVRMNSTTMNTVLDCILQRLDCATKFSSAFLTHSKSSGATADDATTSQLLSPATATSSYNITVLTAYFDILGSIASIEVAKQVNAVYEAKHQNPDLSKKSTALRNYVLDFIFGLSFMSSLHNCISSYRCNRSAARRNENLQRSLRLLSEGEDSSAQGADPPPAPPLINNNNNSNVVYTMLPLGLREVLQLTFDIHSFRQSNQAQYATIIDVNQLDMSSKVDGMSQAYSSAFESQLSHRQAKLFSLAVGYLHNLRMQERTTERKVDVDIRSRGGRNIWRPDEPLSVGDLVDCMDKEKCWFESIVQEMMSDGSIKVHFMGWGSKWDDIVTTLEVPIRIAPLNSKTKNWRADLFEGGLIEIKCNDDLINQKWMWGKVTSLNVDEAWVEVSYSFSNEPTLVKRAWLFGETICPVGMHTKDKSKAAAALIVKPLKKVRRESLSILVLLLQTGASSRLPLDC